MSLHMHVLLDFPHTSPNPKIVRAVIELALEDHYGALSPEVEAHTITPIREGESQ